MKWGQALRLKIRPDEIIDLVKEMGERHDHDDQPDFYTGFAILAERYKGKHDASDRMFSITTRMQCLSDLMNSGDPRLKGYTKSTDDPSCTVTNAAMFHATALCPLKHSDARIWFDPDEFFEIALHQAESEGNA